MSNELQKVENPMGVLRNDGGALAESNAVGAMAEVQAQVLMSKQFPRDEVRAVDKILNECTRIRLAEASTYAYPKGGQMIEGPSIRLAEAIARNWGNLDFGIKEIDQTNGESSVIAYCWDLENNIRESKSFKVKHWRHTKQGGYALTDPRDIYELVANQGARRLRSCILGVIPGDVVDSALEQCALTMTAKADTSKEAVAKLLEAFKPYKVEKSHIEKFIGSRIEAIKPAQVIKLRTIYSSLKDSMSKAWDWFEIEKPKPQETKKIESDLLNGDKK